MMDDEDKALDEDADMLPSLPLTQAPERLWVDEYAPRAYAGSCLVKIYFRSLCGIQSQCVCVCVCVSVSVCVVCVCVCVSA